MRGSYAEGMTEESANRPFLAGLRPALAGVANPEKAAGMAAYMKSACAAP